MLKLSDLRRKRSVEDEDEGTWFVSLSDMLTLLLCFFMLMLSVSHLDQERYKKVASSLEDALTAEKAAKPAKKQPESVVRQSIGQQGLPPQPVILPAIPPIVPLGQPDPAQPDAKADAKADARPDARPDAKPGQESARPKTLDDVRAELGQRFSKDPNSVLLEKRDSGVAVTLKGAVLFDRASADLSPASVHFLDSIAQTLLGTPYKITVEGHTDSSPIQSFVYPSNWELSAARAARVARYLIDRGVPKERLQVLGLADTKPVAPNTGDKGQPLPENQARNRRVVVLINP